MFRRIPSASTFLWILTLTFVTIPLTLGVVSQPAQAGEVQEDPALELWRPTIDNPPEIGLPGDDDQPTNPSRKRDNVGEALPTPVDEGSSGVVSQENGARVVVGRWVESIQRFVGRLGSKLRSPS